MVYKIATVSSVVIPPGVDIARVAPRPSEQRQKDYVSKFDYKTIFYDVFRYGDEIRFSGPPLRNLAKTLQDAEFGFSGNTVTDAPYFSDIWKTQRSFWKPSSKELLDGSPIDFNIEAESLSFQGRVQQDDNALFAKKRVLFTLSKDNPLEWIGDWATFYASVHNVNAIVFYDNGSSVYTTQEILDTLRAVPGIETVVVVDWPFHYGPAGLPGNKYWDSDYCQYSVIEHVRRRFARDAYGLINVDIDELIVSEDGRSVFDYLDDEPSGAITFRSQWIESVTEELDRQPRFQDFIYYDSTRNLGTKKWVIRPSLIDDGVQCNVHSFGSGFEASEPHGIHHRHFMGINSNWKFNRTTKIDFDGERHRKDEPLVRALNSAFIRDESGTIER